ncbi:hypothetical protein N781_00145 [Pontibacillus halophilus JSM 076056 = DSM 19796]|uniref:YaaC n=1 Tax=Pontibacillus halophilus JSM 076056 = DSM 19796 TaxID=1385510 RepID=A0A0A5GR74_9BACI|nr:YaaC family protein [Pontibacillus halophilus]KGX93665.1 hypothetical protein N781_00145 [Pontibacillus halophilus JSM 076056 = DSM 19796]
MNTRNFQSIYTYLQSAPLAQNYLLQCYEYADIEEAEKKSYENTYRFIYHLEHGQSLYEQSYQSPLSIKPILLFYGMSQLLKACLLTSCPSYPENTSVLSHGVTSRKRKKQNYAFLHDEVKIQQKGLFAYSLKNLFHVEHEAQAKYTMASLLKRIPELSDLFHLDKSKRYIQLLHRNHHHTAHLEESVLDNLHWTSSYFSDKAKQTIPELLQVEHVPPTIELTFTESMRSLNHPVLYTCSETHAYAFPLVREWFTPFPEVFTHYLLLYNLSMIARYETEWWGDVIHSHASEDIAYIKKFLAVTERKLPALFEDLLKQKSPR